MYVSLRPPCSPQHPHNILLGTRLSRLDRPQLALSLELRPVNPMQLHELSGKLERFLFRLHLGDRIAADNLLAFGKRSIDDLEPSAAKPNLLSRVAGLEAVRLDDFPFFRFSPTNLPIASMRAGGICLPR